MIKVDLSGAVPFMDSSGPDYTSAFAAHRTLTDGLGAGAEFTGWLELPRRMADGELKSIVNMANRIKSNSEVLIVIGIGGSYLGARAAIEMMHPDRIKPI
jgi:glucose-6-phosphate isomerase